MPNCTSCGSPIPEGQGGSCSMCYGDIDYGNDGYYREWAERQERAEIERQQENNEDCQYKTQHQKADIWKDNDLPF